MQILGRKSRILLVAVAIAMLAALGFSFALWDIAPAKAANADASVYANAKVGDIVTFGRYYQTAGSAELTPIEWIVVDKNEHTGQLTLMSKYVLAYGSYFGNEYSKSGTTSSTTKYTITDANGSTVEKDLNDLVGGINYSQSWSESTARAFLNNLERNDLGGDIFTAEEGLSLERKNSEITGKLLPSIGFSNSIYSTNLSKSNPGVVNTAQDYIFNGSQAYYKRAEITDPNKRLARNGFYDVAFDINEKDMIVPRVISGELVYRWPHQSTDLDIDGLRVSETTVDKVWIPSAAELNINEAGDPIGKQWVSERDINSDRTFEYFKNYDNYVNPMTGQINTTIGEAITGYCTEFVDQSGYLGNYSLPSWISVDVDLEYQPKISMVNYWLRTRSNKWYDCMRRAVGTDIYDLYTYKNCGVRPCVILQY